MISIWTTPNYSTVTNLPAGWEDLKLQQAAVFFYLPVNLTSNIRRVNYNLDESPL